MRSDAAPANRPEQIDRYRIESVLGKGGFGVVYLAYDEQLKRSVAVKVPHDRLIVRPDDAEAYLAEARTVASLDHPNIVPVFDVGATDECPCYVVSKYVEGTTLGKKAAQSRLGYTESASIVALVADALHYAHKQGLVHRDVKPGNILIDKESTPYVVDFGLALREENVGKGPKYAGTPAYMSPEQARGEGHRVDGRSDIFSLGVVLYRLLADRRPFRGDTAHELIEQVTSYEPRPLRQYDENLPKELDRICQKALAKRARERYSSAHDMADDLRHFLDQEVSRRSGEPFTLAETTNVVADASGGGSTSAHSSPATQETSELGSAIKASIRVLPRGLRSFDADDADFFLELLPGPRDRVGFPDSLLFWKSRIERSDPEKTFAVGLIYGPSGCGKSSMMKAGLLPRLGQDVIAVYIEATPDDTESRLLRGLRKRYPALGDELNLKDTLAALRRGQGVRTGEKVLIILDQFEQWLHSRRESDASLVEALRQCDGGRVQCIVMVRDDFWLAVTRFMGELEVELLQGQNTSLVDLFDVSHARKVLAAYGRAFGKLPANSSDMRKEQREFLKAAVNSLAVDGKVICVRLSLFAEMMKSRDWTPRSLKAVGGTKGVGVTFLEETFSAPTAHPKHRLHQKAARDVLKSLLPSSGTDIKGYMRSHGELLSASGYENRPHDFEELIRILDREVRLITPTDPDGKGLDDESILPAEPGQKYYQLTHDYLVPALRKWLTRKQRESRRGRAELTLYDTSLTWNSRSENRFLPSWVENLKIRLWTDKKSWTSQQHAMMSRAGKVHGIRTAAAALLLVTTGFIGTKIRDAVVESRRIARAESLVKSLANADIAQVPSVVADMKAYQQWTEPLVDSRLAVADDGSNEKLHLAIAALDSSPRTIDYLCEQLPRCSLAQFSVVRQSLLPYNAKVGSRLWEIALDDDQEPALRFQALAALAAYAPSDNRWQQVDSFVTNHLTTNVAPFHLSQWVELFRPARQPLTESLVALHADRGKPEKLRETAALVLGEYLRDRPDTLLEVLLRADVRAEFGTLVDPIRPHASEVYDQLLAVMNDPLPAELDRRSEELSTDLDQRRDAHWKRQSLAAVTLVQLGFGDDVWPLLELTPNPSLRSYVIHHLGTLGSDYTVLESRLTAENDATIRRALIQSLGRMEPTRISSSDRPRMVNRLREFFLSDPDSGVHSSAAWALRQWGHALPELPPEKYAPGTDRQWYVNSQGQTLAVIPIATGSHGEHQLLAVACHEVTLQEFQRFRGPYDYKRNVAPTIDCPAHFLSWFEAAEYCNWLNRLEDIPEDQWIYVANENGDYGAGMEMRENWRDLVGYRLPTRDEWIAACRSGSEGTFFYGEPAELANEYLESVFNSSGRSHPAGSLLPNEGGLFDMHGNLWEWLQEPHSGPLSPINDSPGRTFRGGSYSNQAWSSSFAVENYGAPKIRSDYIGFRIVRRIRHDESQ